MSHARDSLWRTWTDSASDGRLGGETVLTPGKSLVRGGVN